MGGTSRVGVGLHRRASHGMRIGLAVAVAGVERKQAALPQPAVPRALGAALLLV